jgi:protein phosphatase
MKQVEFKYHADSNTGLKRKNNEDAFGNVQTKYGNVFIVCDGMGGHAAGEQASQIAVSIIGEYLTNSESQDIPIEIDQAIQHANKSIWEEALHNPSLKGMGTTCVVFYLTNKGEVYIGHVGDSRCYIYKNDEFKTLTKDHSYVQFLLEVGELSEEQAFNHPNKNRILKALGIDEEVSPDVTEFPIKPKENTLFLLCTDGLNDMLKDNEIKGCLDLNKTLEEQTEKLIDEALEKGGKDNVTVGLLHIESNPSYSKSKPKDDTLINKNQSVPTKRKNTKKLIFTILFLLLIAVSYFLFRSWNLKDTNENAPSVQETNVE